MSEYGSNREYHRNVSTGSTGTPNGTAISPAIISNVGTATRAHLQRAISVHCSIAVPPAATIGYIMALR